MNLRQLNRILLQTLLVPVVALLFVAAVLAWEIHKAEHIVAEMQATGDNIATTEKISALTVDEETSIRGYQLTGNEIFLQPYHLAEPRLDKAVSDLRTGLAQQSADPQLLQDFLEAHQTWIIAFAEPFITATANGTDTRDTGFNLRAKAQMDRVRATLNRIIATETLQRTRTLQTWEEHVQRTLLILVALALTVGLAIGLSARNRLHRVSNAFQDTLDALRRNAQLTYESEQRLRTTLTSIAEGVIVCDRENRVELLNAVAQQLTGWSTTESLHQPLDAVFRLLDETTRDPLDIPVLTHPTAVPILPTAILIDKGGVEIPIETSAAPILDRSGKPAGLVLVFRDISEQRRAQTAVIASERLAVAGRLAATLAHEIHNPLDAVVNLLFLLKDNPTPEESAHFLQLASHELDRVAQISRAMLGLYRESKTPVPVHVEEMLESILILIAPQLKQQSLELRCDFAPDATIYGYPAELRQVFLNLIANAADACTAGGFIEVRTAIITERRRSPRNPSTSMSDTTNPAGVTITITDNGSGISAETLGTLFQPFVTTKGEQGTGLGLWVSKGIVEKHGGTITIKSSDAPDDHGTAVTVFLPTGDPTAIA